MSTKLTAEMMQSKEGPVAVVKFGDTVVAEVLTDDVKATSEEVIAPLLAHMFEKAQEDLGYE